jgi:hypothetical protein
MNRAVPFTTDGKESRDSENDRSTQDEFRNKAGTPKLVACLLLVSEERSSDPKFLAETRRGRS